MYAPNIVIGAEGKPVAVLVDIGTWQSIMDRLEDQEDHAILSDLQSDLTSLGAGTQPEGWLSWETFEEALDALESADDVPA